jgi:UDP-glucuronate 4-epimerase
MRFLITGHEGFIGRHVFEYYSSKYDCVGLDIKSGNDITECVLPECDVIIHLAGLPGVRRSKEFPEDYWHANVIGSQRVFEHAERIGARLLYASSSSVKGWYNNPYATTKKVVEMIAPPRSLGMRFHTVYGRDSRPDMMYDMLIGHRARYITNHMRDFTHVDDVVTAIDVLYNNGVCGIVDIGSNNPVSVIELSQAAGQSLPIMQVGGEAHITCANTTLLTSLGWKPTKHVLTEMRNDIL